MIRLLEDVGSMFYELARGRVQRIRGFSMSGVGFSFVTYGLVVPGALQQAVRLEVAAALVFRALHALGVALGE